MTLFCAGTAKLSRNIISGMCYICNGFTSIFAVSDISDVCDTILDVCNGDTLFTAGTK